MFHEGPGNDEAVLPGDRNVAITLLAGHRRLSPRPARRIPSGVLQEAQLPELIHEESES